VLTNQQKNKLDLKKQRGEELLQCSKCNNSATFCINLDGDVECIYCGHVKGNVVEAEKHVTRLDQALNCITDVYESGVNLGEHEKTVRKALSYPEE